MPRDQHKRVSWGSVAAYVCFGAYFIMIGVGAAFRWHALGLACLFLALAYVVVMSSVVLWRAWKHRGEPGGARLGQLAALPRSWRKWVLGERDDDAPDGSSRRPR